MAGVWWDEETQQYYISDTIDFAKGVYVQRILHCVVDTKNKDLETVSLYRKNVGATPVVGGSKAPLMCNVTNYIKVDASLDAVHCYVGSDGTLINVYVPIGYDVEANPIEVMAQLVTPIETPLSPEELAQYAALHTNKPNTTVYNDAGAYMEMEYVADTKLYIDKKFTELQNAILATGANI